MTETLVQIIHNSKEFELFIYCVFIVLTMLKPKTPNYRKIYKNFFTCYFSLRVKIHFFKQNSKFPQPRPRVETNLGVICPNGQSAKVADGAGVA